MKVKQLQGIMTSYLIRTSCNSWWSYTTNNLFTFCSKQPHRWYNLSGRGVVRWGVLALDTPNYYCRLGNGAGIQRSWSRWATWLADVSEDVVACHRSILLQSAVERSPGERPAPLHCTPGGWRVFTIIYYQPITLLSTSSAVSLLLVWFLMSIDLRFSLCMMT